MDVFYDRIVPLVVARAGHAVLHPESWGTVELVIVGGLTQVGLEVYRHGVPSVFASWKHLPARGKPLEVLESRDRQFIACSQIMIVVMTFHYLQYMASSPYVLWRPEEARTAPPPPALAPRPPRFPRTPPPSTSGDGNPTRAPCLACGGGPPG